MRKIKRKRKDWRNDLVTALTLRLGRVSLACQRRGGGTPAAAKDTRFTPRSAQERELRRALRQRECPAPHRENRLHDGHLLAPRKLSVQSGESWANRFRGRAASAQTRSHEVGKSTQETGGCANVTST